MAPRSAGPGRLPHASASQRRREALVTPAIPVLNGANGAAGKLTVEQIAPLVQEGIRLGLITFSHSTLEEINDH
jgi:hypothetical protein